MHRLKKMVLVSPFCPIYSTLKTAIIPAKGAQYGDLAQNVPSLREWHGVYILKRNGTIHWQGIKIDRFPDGLARRCSHFVAAWKSSGAPSLRKFSQPSRWRAV
jgi:hypothetical protein